MFSRSGCCFFRTGCGVGRRTQTAPRKDCSRRAPGQAASIAGWPSCVCETGVSEIRGTLLGAPYFRKPPNPFSAAGCLHRSFERSRILMFSLGLSHTLRPRIGIVQQAFERTLKERRMSEVPGGLRGKVLHGHLGELELRGRSAQLQLLRLSTAEGSVEQSQKSVWRLCRHSQTCRVCFNSEGPKKCSFPV